MFVGLPLCRDNEWLNISVHYTENVFTTVMTLRMLPKFLHSTVVWFLPSSYRVHQNLRRAKQLIAPLVKQRLEAQSESIENYEKPDDMLQWMMDAANEDEGKPDKLAHRQLILTLGAIHTTTMAATHALLDLCTHPEYVVPLREEVENLLLANKGLDKSTLSRMRKMDSFLKESQRFNPPNLCKSFEFAANAQSIESRDLQDIVSFNRVAMEPLKLSDGVVLPQGTHFVVASAPIMMDPINFPNPDEFDGFRFHRMRSDPKEANRHQFIMTTSSELHFGHGKFSCPGRFFAAAEIKMILSHILLEYKFKYPDGMGRPANMTADDNIFPDPAARVLIKHRNQGLN